MGSPSSSESRRTKTQYRYDDAVEVSRHLPTRKYAVPSGFETASFNSVLQWIHMTRMHATDEITADYESFAI